MTYIKRWRGLRDFSLAMLPAIPYNPAHLMRRLQRTLLGEGTARIGARFGIENEHKREGTVYGINAQRAGHQ